MIIDKLIKIYTDFDKENKLYKTDKTAIEGLANLINGQITKPASDTMRQLFENADKLLARLEHTKNYYIQKGYESRTIIFQNCAVLFKRRKYILKKEYRRKEYWIRKIKDNNNKVTFYMLDNYLGIQRYQRLDFDFQLKIISALGDTSSYSKIAKGFENSGISKQVVRNLIANLNIDSLKDLVLQDSDVKLKHNGIIYVENDDAFRKTLNSKGQANQKCLTLSVIHTGFVDPDSKRKSMQNKRFMLTMRDEDSKTNNRQYWNAVKEFIYNNYENADQAQIYVVGDGANKIKICEKYNGWVFVLDRFHVVKKIKDSILGNREYKRSMSKKMAKAVKNLDFEEFEALMLKARKIADKDSNKLFKLNELKKYIKNNLEYIKRWSLKEYIGCRIESYISNFVKVVFRSRPKIFSEKTIHKIFLLKQLLENGINPFTQIREQEMERAEEQFMSFRYRIIRDKQNKKSELPKVEIPILNNFKDNLTTKYLKNIMYNY